MGPGAAVPWTSLSVSLLVLDVLLSFFLLRLRDVPDVGLGGLVVGDRREALE